MKTNFAWVLIAVLGLVPGHIRAIDPTETRASTASRAAEHLEDLSGQPWLAEWHGATLGDCKLVEQKKDLTWATGLPPAWWVTITDRKGATGYLAWDANADGKLIEFAFDAPLKVETKEAKALQGVPALQQFPISQETGKTIASGCVPTSGASVLGYWIDHGFPQWRGDAGETPLCNLARRLRGRMNMEAIPDKDGFTDDEMTLAGASPEDLATAIQKDADAHEVAIECRPGNFDCETLKTEIAAGRPVILSCTVRLPHKPQLSWGHEVAGVGWAKVGEVSFVGVLDNFYPTRNPETIRWIRSDAFDSLITIRPIAKKAAEFGEKP